MELKDLVGEHELSGVDITTERVRLYENYREDCEVVRFVIDGKTYKATEDPDDGYRSYLNEIKVTDEKVTNTFPPQKVIGKMKDDESRYGSNIIQFIDTTTRKVVLEIGTDNSEDYYPCCVMDWSPENLAINTGK